MNLLVEGVMNELNYGELVRNQRSIDKLFPKKFPGRVKQIGKMGGVRLEKTSRKRWHFRAASGTNASQSYIVNMEFKNPEEILRKVVNDRTVWKSDMSGVDMRKVAVDTMFGVDMKLNCTCPAQLYWGGDYILTKDKAKYGAREPRPPRIRNPHEYGEYCKHIALTMETFPFYGSTFATWLKKHYGSFIRKLEQEYKTHNAVSTQTNEPEEETVPAAEETESE